MNTMTEYVVKDPVLNQTLTALGRSQAERLESWGFEIVGPKEVVEAESLKTTLTSDLEAMEEIADKEGWDEIKHDVRDERQTRMLL